MGITEQYQKIRKKIPEHVTIVLAAKTRTPEEVKAAIDAGAMDIGENYLQEAEQMVAMLGGAAKKVFQKHTGRHLTLGLKAIEAIKSKCRTRRIKSEW